MNATREQIVELLQRDLSNSEIARRLRCDRHRVSDIRRDLGIPDRPAQPLSLEEKWATKTRPVGDGHLEWTGSRQSTSGTPVLVYGKERHTAAAIAFRIKHGRPPQGYAYAECGLRHCVAPDHVDDEAGRTQVREQLRYLTGGQERKPTCRQGHDQAAHGRYAPDGVAYCHACHLESKRKRAAEGSTTPPCPRP
jgi:hypothetical protein